MILLLERRICILTPPKTASDTLHRVFCAGPPWNGLALVGPHHGVIDKHYPHVPAEADGFSVLLAVRNPLARLVSLWFHKSRCERYDGHGGESFARFCERLAEGEVQTWLWRTTIAELVGEQPIDGLLHVENLQADLATHGLQVAELPRHNVEWHKPWQAYYDEWLLSIVAEWAAADGKYGYDANSFAIQVEK
jgi:hypothetical protein